MPLSGKFSFPLGGSPGPVTMVNSDSEIRFDEGRIPLNMADIRGCRKSWYSQCGVFVEIGVAN